MSIGNDEAAHYIQYEYSDLLEQATRLEREIEALEKERVRAEKLDEDVVRILDEYRKRRRELSDRRQSFAEGTSGKTIHVEIDAYADRDNLEGHLTDTLGTERFEGDRQALVQRIQPEGESWSWKELDGVMMEGGREAFESRYQRIMPPQKSEP